MAKPGALAKLDDDAAIEIIANGGILNDIARQFGVSDAAVSKRLSKHPDYAWAIKCQADKWAMEATRHLMVCPDDQVKVASARARGAMDYAKVRNPDYADKQQITQLTVNVTADVGFAAELAAKARTFAPSMPHDVVDADIVVDNQHVIGQSNGLLVMREDNAGETSLDGNAVDGWTDGGDAG